jgi:cardiolipin synthase
MGTGLTNFQLFSDPLRLYNSMLTDIENAKKYIYLETYKYGNDAIGIKFKDALIKKARQGVEIKILLDSWGASVNLHFFAELIKLGVEVKFFKKIRWSWYSLTKNHRRDHRKLLLIDDEITYIGSANIASHSFNWRELTIRLVSNITIPLKKTFFQSLSIFDKLFYDKIRFTRGIRHDGFEILRDVPSELIQRHKLKFRDLIKKAKSEIIIETPYFIPPSSLRKVLAEAGKKGVKVIIITPKRSDVGMVDLLRSRFLGELYKNNVQIYFYVPQNLHAKVMLIDNKLFAIGSLNFDYRSFRFQHEISLIGKDPGIAKKIREHIDESLEDCELFNYEYWKKRPWVQKVFEWIFVPFRYLF